MTKLTDEAQALQNKIPLGTAPHTDQIFRDAAFAICYEIAALREEIQKLRDKLPPPGPGGSFGSR
jgi:hypothetical protein